MTVLTTLTVKVMNNAGKPMFMNPRFLRVITDGPNKGLFAVARHKKALVVTGISAPDAVVVDAMAARVKLEFTRAAKLVDIGLTPVERPASKPATKAELPGLVAKYTATIAKNGKAFLENTLRFTKDAVKLEAMEIALGRREAKVKKPAAAKIAPVAAGKIDVQALAKAIAESGIDPAAALAAIAKPAEVA